jgi:DNA-binding ferritin-like protein
MNTSNINIKDTICSFFRFQLNVKMVHWNTRNHNLHKITDALYKSVLDLTDRFVETYLGSQGDFDMSDFNPSCVQVKVIRDEDFKGYLQSVIKSLIVSELYDKVDRDLRAILDEMLELINTNIYLLRGI